MAISTLDRQLLLIQQVGDVDALTAEPISPLTAGATGIVLTNAERLWSMHEDKLSLPILGGAIFDYYFKREAVSLVIAVLESRVDFSAIGTAMSVKLNQRIAARNLQSERYRNEIIRLETRLAALVGAQSVLLSTVEIVTPPQPGDISSPVGERFRPDASDPRYIGSPYWRSALDPSFRR